MIRAIHVRMSWWRDAAYGALLPPSGSWSTAPPADVQYCSGRAVVGGLRWASPVVNSVLTRVWPLRCLWPLTPESLALPPGGGLFLISQHLQQTGTQLSHSQSPCKETPRSTLSYMRTHTNACVCTCVRTVLFRKTAPLQRYLTQRSFGLCTSFLSSEWLMFLSVTFTSLLVIEFVYITNASVKTRPHSKLKHVHLCVNLAYYGFSLFKFLYSVSGQLSCVSPLSFDLFNSEDAQFSTWCKWRLVFTSV